MTAFAGTVTVLGLNEMFSPSEAPVALRLYVTGELPVFRSLRVSVSEYARAERLVAERERRGSLRRIVVAITLESIALSICRTPEPAVRTLRLGSGLLVVLTIAPLIRSVLQSGCASVISAAAPEVIGAAIEVPEMVAAPLPVPTPVETTL